MKNSLAAFNGIMVKRSIPYVPNFNSIPAKSTEPNVGASTWASGNQIWNGGIGTLVANPINKNNHIIICWTNEISE